MASISVTIPDAVLPRVLNAFASRYGYLATLTNADDQPVANPETKAQFAKRMLAEHIKRVVREEEAIAAELTARQQTDAAQNDVIIT